MDSGYAIAYIDCLTSVHCFDLERMNVIDDKLNRLRSL